jgi:hypothetical protein
MPHVTTTWADHRPPQWAGRGQEFPTLRTGIKAPRRSGGTAVWVEGEPGIGKSSMIVEALTGAGGLSGANKNRCRKASSHDDCSSPGPAVTMYV